MRVGLLTLLFVLPGCAAGSGTFEVSFHGRFVPGEGYVAGTIEIRQTEGELSLLDFNAPAARFSRFEADGALTRDGDRVRWEVPERGGRVSYRVVVDHRRGDAFDARMTESWAILRLDDVFPAARARAWKRATATSSFSLSGPPDWHFESRYGAVDGVLPVTNDGRRFDRPTGWLVAGDLAVRRTRIGTRRLAVAGPKGQDPRRMDVLVFLRLTVPTLAEVVPSLPERVLIVTGSDRMWRGGLSGPGSIYLHAGRPLVSGNATSSLLHELMHVAMRAPPADGADWVVEGLAEYYTLVVLERTGAIDTRRFERALASLERWASEAGGTLANPSKGADTARAVLLFRALDRELTRAGANLDAVAGELFGGGPVSVERLVSLTQEALGRPSRVLERALATREG